METSRINRTNLNLQRQRFAEAYFVDPSSAGKAYLAAGYKPTTARALAVKASAMLARKDVQAELTRLRAEQERRTGINGDRIVQELAAIAFSNVEDVVAWDGVKVTVRKLEDIPKDARRAISSVKPIFGKDGEPLGVEIKFHDKLAALAQLARHTNPQEEQVRDLFSFFREIVAGAGGPRVFAAERQRLLSVSMPQ